MCSVLRHCTSSSGLQAHYLIANFVHHLTQAFSKRFLGHLLRFGYFASLAFLFATRAVAFDTASNFVSGRTFEGVSLDIAFFGPLSCLFVWLILSCHRRKSSALFLSLSIMIFLTPLRQRKFLRSSVDLLWVHHHASFFFVVFLAWSILNVSAASLSLGKTSSRTSMRCLWQHRIDVIIHTTQSRLQDNILQLYHSDSQLLHVLI